MLQSVRQVLMTRANSIQRTTPPKTLMQTCCHMMCSWITERSYRADVQRNRT